MTASTPRHRLSRRRLLAAGAAVVGGATAGCLGGGGGTDDTVTPHQQLPHPTAGDPNADVTVAAFEDFACPHCREYNEQVVPHVWDEYVTPGTITYVHYDFPIPVDRTVSWQAPSAARSVQKGTDAATFFEYAARLFDDQSRLGPDVYAELANDVGADGKAARAAATNGTYRPTIVADRKTGVDRGVKGTPTIFVDGVDVTEKHGDHSFDSIKAEIEAHR
ncbi:MAG: DsbA family protein [Haloferacaceae archaeon]